jgi:uncharacterized protein (TIGR03083 family)
VNPDAYLVHLQADGGRLLAAAKTEPTANVPSCPDWDLAGLVKHIGGAHRWVQSMVAARATEMLPFPHGPEDWPAVADWYEEGLAALATALRSAGPDAPVWNWVANGAGPAIFWFRRMAHETSIHSWDAENAVGEPRPIDAELAADGIDEAIGMLAMRLSMQPEPALDGSIGIETTDAAFSRTLRLTPGALEQADGTDSTGATVRGTASDILLWLTGRSGSRTSSVVVDGDRGLADAIGGIKFG